MTFTSCLNPFTIPHGSECVVGKGGGNGVVNRGYCHSYDEKTACRLAMTVTGTVPSQITLLPPRPYSPVGEILDTEGKYSNKVALHRLSNLSALTQQRISSLRHSRKDWAPVHAAFFAVDRHRQSALPCAAHVLAKAASPASPRYLNALFGSVAIALGLTPQWLADHPASPHALRW